MAAAAHGSRRSRRPGRDRGGLPRSAGRRRRARLRRRLRRGPELRARARLRRAPSRVLHLPREEHPPDARPPRRRDRRRRRPTRLLPHPFDPRAAHPPRQGDLEHLHQSGSHGPGGHRLARGHRRPRPRASWRPRACPAPRTSSGASANSAARWRLAYPSSPTFNEFLLTGPGTGDELARRLADEGVLAGVAAHRWGGSWPDGLLVAVTERNTAAEIEALIDALRRRVMKRRAIRDEPLFFERNPERLRRQGFLLPPLDVPGRRSGVGAAASPSPRTMSPTTPISPRWRWSSTSTA